MRWPEARHRFPKCRVIILAPAVAGENGAAPAGTPDRHHRPLGAGRHLPVNTGLRFSRNAETASWWSAESLVIVW